MEKCQYCIELDTTMTTIENSRECHDYVYWLDKDGQQNALPACELILEEK